MYKPAEKEKLVTQELLKSLYRYETETGKFFHLTVPNHRIKLGQEAGHLTSTTGYFVIGIGGYVFQLHRLAWLYVYGEFPSGFIDHINHDRADNRISNLRIASRAQNGMNQKIHRDNRTGFKGVTKAGNRFAAQIRVNGKMKHIGNFATPQEAADAYKRYAESVWGEFAVKE